MKILFSVDGTVGCVDVDVGVVRVYVEG